jgi:zinc transporter ZupT
MGMREQGWKVGKILLLWLSLVVTSALSSYLGYLVGAQVSHTTIVFVEGVAAGAMLTMIAQTMIPEAVPMGGPNMVGLSTLAGFTSSVAFKLLEI